jgi:phenylacetate-CoA oxygenase PaaJ subunit
MTPVSTVPTRIWDALADVQDPELPISIVDMGLVVDVALEDGIARIDLTLTSMGCPAVDMITEDIRERLIREAGVNDVRINIVWDPIWTTDRLTADGKMALREWGISL